MASRRVLKARAIAVSFLVVFLVSMPSDAASSPSCDVTAPNGRTPPGEEASDGFHGNGKLWTGIWPDGTVVFKPGGPGFVLDDGSLKMKFFWYSAVEGELTIEGRRIDAPAAPLRADVRTALSPKGFHPSYLIFPTEGCWEVTARAGAASLSIVTRVVREHP